MTGRLLLGSILVSLAAHADVVNFSTFVTASNIAAVEGGQTNVIGFTYAGNKFVGSMYFGANNDQLYQTDLNGGNVQKFGAAIPNGFGGEVVVGASLGVGGFSAGSVFAGAGGDIYRYSNDGSTRTLFGTVPSTARYILFDPGSTFGGKMLVSTSNGQIYSFDSLGNRTLLTSVGEDTEGMDIATAEWGPYAGDLMVASEGSGRLRIIDTNGNIVATSSANLIPIAETVSFVPSNLGASGSPVEGFYVANYATNIQKAAANQFSTLVGDVIVTSEDSSNARVWAIAYSGIANSPFGTPTVVGNLTNQSEDGIFVTAQRIGDIGTPEPGSLLRLGTLVAGLGGLMYRKARA